MLQTRSQLLLEHAPLLFRPLFGLYSLHGLEACQMVSKPAYTLARQALCLFPRRTKWHAHASLTVGSYPEVYVLDTFVGDPYANALAFQLI